MTMQTANARSLIAKADRLARKGQPAQARQTYRAVLADYPGNRRARDGVAALTRDLVLPALRPFQAGDWVQAMRAAVDALEVDPHCQPVLEIVAACHRHMGQPEQALPVYDRLIALSPTPEFRLAKGAALQEAGRPGAAVAVLEPALIEAPTDRAGGISLARCRLAMGHPRRALTAVEAVLAAHPEDTVALAVQGEILMSLGMVLSARQALTASLRDRPSDAAPLATLAQLARATGDRALAARLTQRALALHPETPALHRNLSMVRDYEPQDPHVAQMQELLPRTTGMDGQSQLHFALFNAFDQIGDRPRAMEHLTQANTLRRLHLRYDPARDAAFLPWLRSLAAPPICPAPDGVPVPVFVIGLPRSGTTLTEALLARHTGARPAGELPVVNARLAPVLRHLQAAECSTLSTEMAADLTAQLRDDLAQNACDSEAVIDKMPLNFRYLHLLAQLLPEARFIHLSRDPMANGWSLLRHCFGGLGNGFAYSADDIAHFMALERAHLDAIAPMLEGRLLRLPYEALVAAPQDWSRTMAAHCGLSWSEGQADGPRAILTASTDQVRQPIRTDANAGWVPYARWLDPLTKALKNAGLEPDPGLNDPSQIG